MRSGSFTLQMFAGDELSNAEIMSARASGISTFGIHPKKGSKFLANQLGMISP